MKTVIEIEIWSSPGGLLPPDYGKRLQEDFWAEGIPRDVVLGLNSIPDETDSENLRLSLEAGELAESDFRVFCEQNKFAPDVADCRSAAAFLEYSFGRPLAWVHIPDGEYGSLLPNIRARAKALGLILVNPDQIACIL